MAATLPTSSSIQRNTVPNLEEVTRDWPLGAVIAISAGGETLLRPAAFVFDVPGGFAWVEPSYADPSGAASPSFHRRPASDIDSGAVQVLQFFEVDADAVGDGLLWFADWLKAEGRTWAEERERVRELLGDSLA